MRGWQQARITNLEENGARLREKSSSVFQSENDDEKHHHELLRYSGIKIGKVEPTMKRILKDLGERHLTDEKFILTSNLEKEFESNTGKREESGKILGKDLWVRAHSKDTPLKRFEER